MPDKKDLTPRAGALAYCSIGLLGLITSDTKERVEYSDGNTGEAWTGIQLQAKTFPGKGEHANESFSVHPGDNWSSRNPTVVAHIDDVDRTWRMIHGIQTNAR